MSWSLRRAVLTLGPVTLFCTAALLTQADVGMARPPVQVAQALQKRPPLPQPDQPPKDPTEFSQAIELPKNPDASQMLAGAKDYIDAEEWNTACTTLQKILMYPENYFTKVPRTAPDGKQTFSWVSVKAEADRLIATLPQAGKDTYKVLNGPKAAELLKEAKATSDVEKLSIITRFYLHTDAGGEATNLLATYHLDRGEYIAAALCYEKLLSRDDADKLSVTALFRAAYAFKTTGDTANEKVCWGKINTRRGEIQIGNVTKTVEELQEYIAKNTRVKNDTIAYDTNLVGSVPSRSAQGKGGPAFLERRWQQPLARTTDTQQWIEKAEASLQNKQPLIPAMQPITATIMHNEQKLSLVVFRSHWGIHAVDMKTGKLKWETPSNWSMDRMFRDTKKVGAVNQWALAHLSTRPNLLVENSTVGTLSTDGSFVFAVEDFGIPPINQFNQGFGNPNFQQNFGSPEINDAVNASKLQAFELSTGKLKWEVGGVAKKDEKKDELADSYFLGSPLPMGGKLYALVERQQDLRLACLDPMTGKLLHIQTLATARDKMMVDIWRRIQATHLAYGEGILVCPTNSGALLGVDLLSNSLVWAYPYRDKTETENATDVIDPRFGRRGGIPPGFIQGPDGRFYNPNINTQWKVSPPVIVDGKVVFTAPDANKIHCISLRDGGAVWSQQRAADDLYLGGVYSGKAIIVGKGYVRALSLAKGEQAWRVETGVPSGYGVASDNYFYLPLKEAGPNKEPEICRIDIERGQLVAHTKSRKKADEEKASIPGNLLFYEGDVLSQTALSMTAYPQLEVQVAKMDEALRKNPNDPEGLFQRGQLRLDKGDLKGAIDDLRDSLKNNPPKDVLPQAREKLYDSFTEYFQRDFTKAEEYLKEYEEMCKIDVTAAVTAEEKSRLENEQRRRRANFLCLVAKGKEAQGKLVDAFNRYQEFASEAEKFAKESGKDELMPPLVDEPNVRAAPQVWSGGRIAAMVAKATPENRKPLEDLITKKWEELKKTEDINEIRNFVHVFGSLFTVGKEARLELANRLMDDSDPKSLLEAEQQLAMLRVRGEDPKLAGRAVETLARLCTRKGLLEDASYYYRVLRDEYAKVPVRDGRTGSDLFNDMATDKRLLPHLDVPTHGGVTGKHVKGDEHRVVSQYNQQVYDFGHVGEKLPFFQKHRVGIRFDYHQLKITDLATGEEKSKNLTRTNFQNMIYGNGQPNLPKYNYMTMGHLVVLPIAHMVFGIDPIRGEVLWERNLYGEKTPIANQPGLGGVPNWNQFIVDPKDNSILLIYPPPGEWVQRIGGPGTLEGAALCLQTREGLVAIDPVTNKTLWTRSNISSRSRVFNDDQYIYIVEEGSDGNAASTKVLRAYDGVSINVPDFSTQYQKRVRQVGRNLLLSETNAKGQMTYRLYDVLTGKDLWSAPFAANSRVLHSEDPNFGGVVEPDGTVHVIDIRNGKEAMKAKMKPADIEKVTSAHLLYDGQYFYVACNNPMDPALQPWGGVQTNLMPGTGLRSLPVNGMLYAFDAQTGKTKWVNPLLNQMIVLDHFADMPVVIATSRYNKWMMVGAGRQVQQVVALEAIAKSGGKFVFQRENQQWQQFHALNLDPKKSTIELVNYQSKIIFTASNEPFKKP